MSERLGELVKRFLKGGDTEVGEAKQEKPHRYGIETEGGLSYIVDGQGRRVSKGYHKFDVFRSEDGDTTVEAIVGKIGSQFYLLKPPLHEGEHFEATAEGFHEIVYRPDLDGLLLTQLGALWYVLDVETGERSTEGYHEIYREGDKIYGKKGAIVTEIKRVPRKLAHNIELLPDLK